MNKWTIGMTIYTNEPMNNCQSFKKQWIIKITALKWINELMKQVNCMTKRTDDQMNNRKNYPMNERVWVNKWPYTNEQIDNWINELINNWRHKLINNWKNKKMKKLWKKLPND